MQNLSWAVQTNLTNADDTVKIDNACRRLGLMFHPYEIIPFSDELPEVPNDQPTVFYGSTTAISKVDASGKWSPGVCLFHLSGYRSMVSIV